MASIYHVSYVHVITLHRACQVNSISLKPVEFSLVLSRTSQIMAIYLLDSYQLMNSFVVSC